MGTNNEIYRIFDYTKRTFLHESICLHVDMILINGQKLIDSKELNLITRMIHTYTYVYIYIYIKCN